MHTKSEKRAERRRRSWWSTVVVMFQSHVVWKLEKLRRVTSLYCLKEIVDNKMHLLNEKLNCIVYEEKTSEEFFFRCHRRVVTLNDKEAEVKNTPRSMSPYENTQTAKSRAFVSPSSSAWFCSDSSLHDLGLSLSYILHASLFLSFSLDFQVISAKFSSLTMKMGPGHVLCRSANWLQISTLWPVELNFRFV